MKQVRELCHDVTQSEDHVRSMIQKSGEAIKGVESENEMSTEDVEETITVNLPLNLCCLSQHRVSLVL